MLDEVVMSSVILNHGHRQPYTTSTIIQLEETVEGRCKIALFFHKYVVTKI